jgi:hypothetical protein
VHHLPLNKVPSFGLKLIESDEGRNQNGTADNRASVSAIAMKVGDIVKTCNLQTVEYNDRRGKIIQMLNENGRYGVKLLLEDSKTKDVLLTPQNLVKLPGENHYGFWGCSDCGGQCDCLIDGSHSSECNHYMNTLRRKGPLCDGAGKCIWLRCCLSESLQGPCKVLDRNCRHMSTYKYPEREWTTLPDGSKTLQPKSWPYF